MEVFVLVRTYNIFIENNSRMLDSEEIEASISEWEVTAASDEIAWEDESRDKFRQEPRLVSLLI
jgi:hypothetical protein